MIIRLEGIPQRYHEEHISAKGMNSLSHEKLGAQVYSYASGIQKFPLQRQQWKNNGKIGENSGVEHDESQKQERGDR